MKAFVFLFCLGLRFLLAARCGNKWVTLGSANSSVAPLQIFIKPYSCPVPGVPNHWTECCDPPSHNCCKVVDKVPSNLFEIDQTTGVIVAVAVILLCVASAILMAMCCFWERCPLYMICRNEPKPDDLASPDNTVYSAMPNDNENDARFYSPQENVRLT